MRPKKRVLLYCADELRLSVTACVLAARGRYAVTQCHAADMVSEALEGDVFAAAIVMESAQDQDHGELIVQRVKAAQQGCRVILALLAPGVTRTIADRTLLHDMRCLLETLRIVCTHKRHPRKEVFAPGYERMAEPGTVEARA